MLCIKPYVKGGTLPLPCNQCMPCRINNRRVWTSRMYLELLQHRQSCFVTLTYDPANLPVGGTLVRRDLQLYLKRLRKSVYPLQVRYFGVGEYGDNTFRPHYHVVLYGLGRMDHDAITKSWGLGLVHIGDVTMNSIQYVAGYVTKKMTKKDDIRLGGRTPEFALMSRRPGIGSKAAEQMAHQMTSTSSYAGWLNKNGDVPHIARQDGKMMPLGRYMVSKIREGVGFENGNSPPLKKAEYLEKMQAMRADVGNAAFVAAKPFVDWSKADQLIHRVKLRNPRRTI